MFLLILARPKNGSINSVSDFVVYHMEEVMAHFKIFTMRV